MNCIILACYLPSNNKKYVIKEILEYISRRETRQTVFVGIQANSIPETEEIIRKSKGSLNIKTRRVKPEMMIDSDASSFLAALELYRESDKNFEKVYFCHTKGITSNNDDLRHHMYKETFDNTELVDNIFLNDRVGSFAPYITVTNVAEDIAKMETPVRFSDMDYPVMEYYYINTFFIIKNSILKTFIEDVDDCFFTTPIHTYSDRYFFERDFAHIVDMQGFIPSFKYMHGNYSTNYRTPSIDEFNEKLSKWVKECHGHGFTISLG